jgi:MerR family transcriptional regulator, copper efflux regulator
MTPQSMNVGELADRAGVGVQTLHYYERLGLLPKADRSSANYRLYSPASLRRVRFIKQAQALGFTLEEIKEVLDLREQGRAPCRCVADVARKHLRDLDARIKALREFRKSLAAVGQRRCAGEFCDLIEQLTESRPAPAAGKKNKIKFKKIKSPLTL